jgi:hypothetical protein
VLFRSANANEEAGGCPGGFAGFTELWDRHKPVIAAVNGIAVGGGGLILYNEILQFGERMVNRGVEPLLALWLPLVVFLSISGLLFYRTAFVAGEPSATRSIEGMIDRLVAFVSRNRVSRDQNR